MNGGRGGEKSDERGAASGEQDERVWAASLVINKAARDRWA